MKTEPCLSAAMKTEPPLGRFPVGVAVLDPVAVSKLMGTPHTFASRRAAASPRRSTQSDDFVPRSGIAQRHSRHCVRRSGGVVLTVCGKVVLREVSGVCVLRPYLHAYLTTMKTL